MTAWSRTPRKPSAQFALGLFCLGLAYGSSNGNQPLSEAFDAYRDGLGEFPPEAIWFAETHSGSYTMQHIDCSDAIFVMDTSGSMKDPATSLIRSDVMQRLEVLLQAMPDLKHALFLDNDGRHITKWPKSGRRSPQSIDRQDIETITKTVRLYPFDSRSNFQEGLKRAVKLPKAKHATRIFALGDESNLNEERLKDVVRQTERLNKSKVVASGTDFPSQHELNSRSEIVNPDTVWFYISLQGPHPDDVSEYRAALERSQGDWHVTEWLTLLETRHPPEHSRNAKPSAE